MTMEKVGLIAGNGKLPKLFLNQCILKGIEPFSVYLFESVEDSVKEHKNSVKYSVAQVGKIISAISHFQQLDLLFPLSFFIFSFLFFL